MSRQVCTNAEIKSLILSLGSNEVLQSVGEVQSTAKIRCTPLWKKKNVNIVDYHKEVLCDNTLYISKNILKVK